MISTSILSGRPRVPGSSWDDTVATADPQPICSHEWSDGAAAATDTAAAVFLCIIYLLSIINPDISNSGFSLGECYSFIFSLFLIIDSALFKSKFSLEASYSFIFFVLLVINLHISNSRFSLGECCSCIIILCS